MSSDDYIESIGFTIYAYLTNKIVKRDLMKGSDRSLGEFLEHFIRGKLAEFAFKKYLSTIGVESLIDVDLPVFIPGDYLPDILAIRKGAEWEPTRFWLEVKAVTPKQKWMLIATTSVVGGGRSHPRPYCSYVNCVVDLPTDHLAHLLRYSPKISKRMSSEWSLALKDIDDIPVEILGYALFTDIESVLRGGAKDRKDLDAAFGLGNWRLLRKHETFLDPQLGKRYGDFGRDNCIIRLSRLRNDWSSLQGYVRQNQALAPTTLRDTKSFENEMSESIVAIANNPSPSWFSRSLTSGIESVQESVLLGETA